MENTPISTTPLGAFLREQRESRHITIEQVASATKINIKLLHALEGDDYDELPAMPFVRGFVLSYTRYLGLDAHHVMSQYGGFLEEKSGKKFKRPADAPHIFVEKEGQSDNSKTILTVVMATFLIVAVVLFTIIKPTLKRRRSPARDKAPTNQEIYTVVPPSGLDRIQDQASVPNQELDTSPAPTPDFQVVNNPPKVSKKPDIVIAAAQPIKTPAPKTVPTPSPQNTQTISQKWPNIPPREVRHILVVQAIEDSWIKYQADDFSLRQYTLRKGQKLFIRARQSIRFRVFKEKGVEISYDTKKFSSAGNQTLIIPKSVTEQYKDRPFLDSSLAQ